MLAVTRLTIARCRQSEDPADNGRLNA